MKWTYDVKGASVYRKNPVHLNWNERKEGECLAQVKPWIVEYIVQVRDINSFEIYTLVEKDKSETHWLVEHNMLQGTGKVGSGTCKVECIPQYPVELVKKAPDNPEYWIVKRKDWPS